MTTRIVVLPEDARERDAADEVTRVLQVDLEEIRPTFERSFVRHYGVIREALAHNRQPGLMAFAVAPGLGVRGQLWLKADGGLRTAIVGRHTTADLHLPGDPDLSLRHLAILTRSSAEGVRTRLVDLRTGRGFEDESGRRLEGLVADGPVFVAAARYQLLLFPTPLGADWPEDATAAWRSLPPRMVVLAEEKRPLPRHAAVHDFLAHEVLRRHLREGSVITQVRGPMPMGKRLVEDDEDTVLGTLAVQNWMLTERLPIGARAAGRGILLGRYPRCDSAAMSVFGNDRISRVHALLVLDNDELWLVDTASKNGIWHDGVRVPAVRLDRDVSVEMGGKVRLTWEAATGHSS